MEKIFKTRVIIGGIISAGFLILGANFANGAMICSYKGPDVSGDFLRLTDFSVSGNSSLNVGDTVTVRFSLQNYGQVDLKLGSKGFFAATRNPDNLDASFGFTRANTTVKVGETVFVEVSRVLDKAGTWRIWPSYQILVGKEYKLGPDNWHTCVFDVAELAVDSDKDGIPDQEDNCPQNYNPKQEDTDKDGIGDACDACDDRDFDNDRIKNCLDQCPNEPENYNQYQDNDGCPDEVITSAPPPLEPAPLPSYCGNGRCEEGENQANCCRDCGCPSGQVCSSGTCQTITSAPPPTVTTAPITPSPREETYIVGFIYSIKIHDDQDSVGPGEMMMAAFSTTGEKVQKIGWPAQMWVTVNGGATLNQSIPLFAFKENEMGDSLAISITAVDNDSWPSWLSWLEGLVGFFADLIDMAWSLVLSVLNSVFTSIRELELRIETVRLSILHDFLVGNDEIGAINKIYTRAEDWGIWPSSSEEPAAIRGRGFSAKIWIGRVTVPKDRNYRYTVKVKNVSFSDTGDYANGEVWINLRAAANFDDHGNLITTSRRQPDHGTWNGGDGSLLGGPRMFAPDGTEMERMALFFVTELRGPFIFLEANAWDEDNPSVGDDHDLIGEYSTIVLFPDFDLPPVTMETNYAERTDYPWIIGENVITMPFVTRGNMRLNFEISRELEL